MVTEKHPANGNKTASRRTKGRVRLEVYGEEMVEKVVKLSGNSGRVYLPPDWVGSRVKIIRLDWTKVPMASVLDHITIRGVRDEDAADITSIQSAITKSSENIDFRHVIEEQMRNFENVSFVAEIDGQVVGYMFSYILFGGFGLEKSAWIATLGVHPKFMGQGIGKRLAEEILTVYKDKCVRSIYTSVRWDSVDLLSFFKTLGFDRSHFINLKREMDV